MKKTLIVLVLILSVFLSSCSMNESGQDTYTFYYPRSNYIYNSNDGVISQEHRKLHGMADDVASILNEYLKGPSSADLSNPFPTGASVAIVSMDKKFLTASLSSVFSTLTELEMTLACTCIVKTIFALTDVDTVILRADGRFSDGSIYRAFSRKSFLTDDNAKELGIARQEGE